MFDPNNKVSFTITPEKKAEMIAHLRAVRDFFTEMGPALTAAQRHMQSISTERAGMLDVFPAEMNANPQFRPSWINMIEVGKDVTGIRDVQEIVAEADSTCTRVKDIDKLLGNDLLLAFNSHFASTREAAKRNQPGALDSYNRMAPYYSSGSSGPAAPAKST